VYIFDLGEIKKYICGIIRERCLLKENINRRLNNKGREAVIV